MNLSKSDPWSIPVRVPTRAFCAYRACPDDEIGNSGAIGTRLETVSLHFCKTVTART